MTDSLVKGSMNSGFNYGPNLPLILPRLLSVYSPRVSVWAYESRGHTWSPPPRHDATRQSHLGMNTELSPSCMMSWPRLLPTCAPAPFSASQACGSPTCRASSPRTSVHCSFLLLSRQPWPAPCLHSGFIQKSLSPWGYTLECVYTPQRPCLFLLLPWTLILPSHTLPPQASFEIFLLSSYYWCIYCLFPVLSLLILSASCPGIHLHAQRFFSCSSQHLPKLKHRLTQKRPSTKICFTVSMGL